MTVLQTVRDLALPQTRLASGAVYQTVWNALTGRPPDHGVKDYDIFYFDEDTGWDAEDRVIRRAGGAFAGDLADKVEVRNQARVHLWFEGKFGEPYPALSSTDESFSRFVAPAFAVGARLEHDDQLTLVAPFGLDDLFAMRLRPNPLRVGVERSFDRIVDGLRGRWPELTVVD